MNLGGACPNVLLVEDDANFSYSLADVLRLTGFHVETASSQRDAFQLLSEHSFDAYVVDLRLPDGSGTDLCRQIKQRTRAPVVMVSGGSGASYSSATEAGADDFLAKPLHALDLAAILQARIRQTSSPPILQAGGIRLDAERREVTDDGQVLNLTPREMDLLHYFMVHAGEALSQERILRDVWGWDWRGDPRTLHVHVHSLRRKFESAASILPLTTIRGYGYRFEERPS